MPSSKRQCIAHYRKLHKACGGVLEESFKQFGGLQCTSHNYIGDMDRWHSIIEGRLEAPMLALAIREYQFALLALTLGKYRTAFVSLRIFLELSLSMVQFSAHEYRLRQWLRGTRDVNWQSIVENQEGIFSKNFANAFCEDLADELEVYRSLSEKLYRECSEYVHSNFQLPLPQHITFNARRFQDWHEMAKKALLVVHFAFFLRYSSVLSPGNKRALEQSTLAWLGHIEGVRAFFGATT